MNTRKTGTFYETAACEYLKKQGVKILERNYRCKCGEIDLIVRDGDCIVFTEVKYRRSDRHGEAISAVHYAKQKKICRCATVYCLCHPLVTQFRFDVVAITDTKIEWIKNAFEYIGYNWG